MNGEVTGHEQIRIPELLPTVPLRDMVLLPFAISPLMIGRPTSVKAVDEALKNNRLLFMVAQKQSEVENPRQDDLFTVGVVVSVLRMIKMPDGTLKTLVQGLKRARLVEVTQWEPFILSKIQLLEEGEQPKFDIHLEALKRATLELVNEIVQITKVVPPEFISMLENIQEVGRLADLIASNLNLKVEEAQAILEETDPVKRLTTVNKYLARELELLKVKQKIEEQAKQVIDKAQKEYFLREQLKAIKSELGELDDREKEIQELQKRIEEALMPEQVKEEAFKQLKRLQNMHPDSAEASVVRTYLDWLLELPWQKYSTDNLDISRARKILDEDHYDLEKVKERIIEFLAVKTLKPDHKGPILCFVGPPGVGKTSLGKSIARALGREFVRVSLGGVRDEAEIRGHRRTYVGAMPGKIIQGIRQAKTSNPVFMLDEVDKLGMDFRGDPSSALLEVLDPEQNFNFVDHYINLPYDLSRVMFICTANITDTIPPALIDRLEVIYLPGYTEEEKVNIAKKYLIPRQCKENGLDVEKVKFTDDAIVQIIRGYTREAGLRNLERNIASVLRKVAVEIVEKKRQLPVIIKKQSIRRFLGNEQYQPETELGNEEVGVALGLAWTPYGGEVLKVECVLMKGGKGNLILTGHLGEIMKESARAALSFARARSGDFDIDENLFNTTDIHVHVPAGAIPKDGPSAGVTIAVAIISAFKNTRVRKDVAMTGEVTVTGKILPVGGIKEKVLGALRYGIKEVVLPAPNQGEVQELPPYVKRKMQFHFIRSIEEAVRISLAEETEASVAAGRS